jgi:repressor LexA
MLESGYRRSGEPSTDVFVAYCPARRLNKGKGGTILVDRKTTPRQQAILDVIKEFQREHGYPPSVREIGERVGLSSSSTVQSHLRTLQRKGLIHRDATKPRALVTGSEVSRDVVTLPLVGRIAAGPFATAAQDVETEIVLPSNLAAKSGSFMLRVKGDSMVDAAILDGDLIVVHPQQVADNGDIVVAMVEGVGTEGEATVKTFYKEANRVRLQPANKYMEPIYSDNVQVIGKVSAVIRKL